MIVAAAATIAPLFARAATFVPASQADVEKYAIAAGGDEVRKIDNGDGTIDFIHIFTNTAKAASFEVPADNIIRSGSGRILVVGGGGSGSGNCGGGGGAGGLIYKEGLTVASGTITVGAGGAQSPDNSKGNNGFDTTVSLGALNLTAFGGGTGGMHQNQAASNGGSGGGGSGSGAVGAATQTGQDGYYGNAGGAGANTNRGGGGGGAGGAGKAAVSNGKGGDGGAGLEFDISGENLFYAAGGGGGTLNSDTYFGLGGSGIGGNGRGRKNAAPAGAGKDGTGSGGGGAAGGSPGSGGSNSIGGAGGSGVVVIRYTIKEPVELLPNSRDDVYLFTDTESGTIFNISKAVRADILVVGGGGAGANPGTATARQGGAGGGGAGGVVEAKGVYLHAGRYAIIVGTGGVSPSSQGNGGDGEPSRILFSGVAEYEAFGGGGGGIKMAGNNGASGGGGSVAEGGTGIAGQGYRGGVGKYARAGAGGGGASGAGGDTIDINVAGSGGLGLASSISGTQVYYAAGGGGGTRDGIAMAIGGSGIGGNGGYVGGSATDGKANTGSGGGGGRLNERGGNGGSGIVIIRVIEVMPDKPNATYEFSYDGESHLLYEGGRGVTITKDGKEVSEIAEKDVGTYNYTVTLKDGYKWADSTENKVINVEVTVTVPEIIVESLSIEPWQVGQIPSKPTVVTKPFQLKESEFTVVYSKSGSGPWSASEPTEAGTYYVTLEIPDSPNYTSPSEGNIPKVPVTLWAWDDSDKYLDSLGYHSKITITATNETVMADFPMLVKIKADMPKGFRYKYANSDGSDIRFIDSNGEILAHEIDGWNPDGESTVWVKVPEYRKGATITMCWGELVGKTPPPVKDVKDVWSAYVGVWHMNDEVNAKNGGRGVLGTANLEEIEGIVGRAYRKTAGGAHGAILQANDSATKTAINALSDVNTFTVSCWIKLNGNVEANSTILGTRTLSINSSQAAWGVGFSAARNASQPKSVRVLYNTGNSYFTKDHWISNEWRRLTFKISKSGYPVEVWLDDVKNSHGNSNVNPGHLNYGISFGGLCNNATGASLNGGLDEIRVIADNPTDSWIITEYEQVVKTLFEFGETLVTPGAYFKNRWVREPSVSKKIWVYGEEPGVIDAGEAAYGETYYTFTGLGGAVTNSVPNEIGSYAFVGQAEGLSPVENGAIGYESLRSQEIDVIINGESPDSNLGGLSGNPTLAGRVLLANDWGEGADAITGQSYWFTNSVEDITKVYWNHWDESKVPFAPNLLTAKMHELLSADYNEELCGSKVIWHLENVRIGNWHNEELLEIRNYLPQSPFSGPLRENGQIGARDESAHLVMRNIKDAAIYSPCYTNGIGTIYFDAVNALVPSETAPAEGFKLVLEVCTVATNEPGKVNIPTDENIRQIRDTVEYDENGNPKVDEYGNQIVVPGETNRYGNAEWKAVKIFALKRDGTENFSEPIETEELTLDIANGGTAQYFYRVYAKINYNGPIRFRIRRQSAVTGINDKDNAFILIDNVIASYPSMRADLESCGTFDPTAGGKAVLGFEKAFNVPFPAVGDEIYGRAKVKYTVSAANPNADVSKFVIGSKMCYRWRYLNQKFDDWREVMLDHKDGFKAIKPLTLPKGFAGDVEYYYVSRLNAPFYDYVDYSGSDLKLGGYYTENNAVVTNRFDSPVILESRGTDWFVRLREGKSEYERINLVVAEEKDGYYETTYETTYKTNTIAMELVGDNVWRGLYQTPEANPKGFKYRIEAINRQQDASEEVACNTNLWKVADNWTGLPVSDVMTAADSTDDWSTLPCDGVTGYVLFQLDDTTRSITIVHADYQNFNSWNDANSNGNEIFVGNSTEDESKVGAAPQATYSKESFAAWKDMPTTDKNLWEESFTTTVAQEYGDYAPFKVTQSPNGWTAGYGMWVYGLYKDGTKVNGAVNRGFQMQGQGYGYIEFVNPAKTPRGVESISFSARLAQSINFTDFVYYDAADKMLMTNYTFIAPGNFDLKSNKGFTGNASLSLVAYYRPGVGCYEFRFEQITADQKKGGINTKGQKLSIYRWNYNSDGDMVSTPLLEELNNFGDKGGDTPDWPAGTTHDGNSYVPLYISISNTVDRVAIAAGYMKSTLDAGASAPLVSPYYTVTNTISDIKEKRFNSIRFVDTSSDRIQGGTYGLLSANCEGIFVSPKTLDKAVSIVSAGGDKIAANEKFAFSGASEYDTSDDIFGGRWAIPPSRMTVERVGNSTKASIRAKVPTQTVDIYFAGKGNTNWKFYKSVDVTTFGAPGEDGMSHVNVYTNADCSVRFAAGGEQTSKRTDVIIDNISVTQFRGGEWEDALGYAENWVEDSADGGYRNFIFTTSWIKNGAIMLSARRTVEDMPSSIRAPLYDDYNGRGVGLGMMAFNYKNAHKDVNLLLQIATNVTQYSMGNIDRIDDHLWTTVTNFSFKGLSPTELAKGTRSHYIGKHGVSGVMRLIMDPKVVKESAGLTEPSEFPEIYITDIITRDEPALDFRAWWGWNLRTLGDAQNSEGRMYLYDFTSDLEQNGMSLALNNSVSDDVADPMQDADFRQHQPFVQTPTFATNVVGEVAFKARKYDTADDQPAQVTLYGSVTGAMDSPWERIAAFIVSNDVYTAYSYKTEPGNTFAAFRLGVTGVAGVQSTNPSNQSPEGYDTPVRVLIDEVVVSEAIRASLAFRGVGAFRGKLDTTGFVPNVPSQGEQPLSGESWGVQCEIFAAQLADEIDFNRKPTVRLHWYQGEIPWGFENWRTNRAAKSALLARATETNLIYRSSYRTAPDAVIPPSFADTATVQYELEVVYYTVGSSVPQTNYLSKAGSWINPAWYRNVNKNDGKKAFSAYTILDSVAPGWAWINEVNILGGYDEYTWANKDADYQYVEIAVPAEASISNWSIRFVEALTDYKVTTNTVATFGINDLKPTKDGLKNMASNMVYRVVASPDSRTGGKLKYADGTLDGVWKITTGGNAQNINGVINGFTPIAVQLVRASGVVEHEVSLIGENFYDPGSAYYETYHPSNMVTRLNRLMPGSRFVYIGDDDQGEGVSLSVMTERGETKENWLNNIRCTPGSVNEGQIIDPDHPTPNGSSILVYAQLDAFGHIYQTIGDAVNTNGSMVIVIPKGSQKGTNITYTVDRWYELNGVTTNGVAANWTETAPGRYTANVGAGASNNVTVVASAKLDDRLVSDYGLTPDNRYRDAVIDWLEKGVDVFGKPWANRESDQIRLAEYQSLSGNYVTNLTLTQMYWLDMDPTVGDLALRGGMVQAPQPLTRSIPVGGGESDYMESTNFKMGVKLYITNKTDDVTSEHYNKSAWAPYVLRGLNPGESSLDYSLSSPRQWTNVTFKITGLLHNQKTSLSNRDNWIPLRWFVFKPDSFNEDFVTTIEVKDPFGTESPGYSAGWYDWVMKNGPVPVFFSWSLDTRLRQFPVEDLKKENLYE